MRDYDLIVFDWDGTLMDSTALIAASLQNACRDVGAAVPSERDARFVIGLNLADTLRHVAPGIDPDTQQRLIDRYRFHFLAAKESPLFDGIPELLGELRDRGKRLAVATGKARRGLERALAATGLAPYFEATRCADEGFAKPHPGMLHALLDCTGVDPERAVMVGDTTHDLELAANAGIDAIAVLYGAHHPELLDTRGAVARCASVEELRRCLSSA
jgi:phosphoglycolate phosphatase